MSDAEKAALLLEDAAAATPTGRKNWMAYAPAVATYRQKNLSWSQIWQRMATLGLVALDDAKAFHSFRCTMSRKQTGRKTKLEAAAK